MRYSNNTLSEYAYNFFAYQNRATNGTVIMIAINNSINDI